MKKLVAAIAVLTSGTVSAYDYRESASEGYKPNVETVEQDRAKREEAANVDVCEVSHSLAETVMKARQNGLSMTKVYNIAKRDETGVMAKLTIAAYDLPRYSTSSMQQRSINDFADKVFLTCVQSQQ